MQPNEATTFLNEETSSTLIAQAPAGPGSWQASSTCPINPIHAALLRTGKVLFIAGSGNNPNGANEPRSSAVWTPSNGTFVRPLTPTNSTGQPLDLFCVGHSFRGSGNLMCAGGTLQYDPFLGLDASFFFNPSNNQWSLASPMNRGRWYPTCVTLGTNKVLALSGLDTQGGLDRFPEIYDGGTGTWTAFSQQTSPFELYAHLFLLSSGKIFYSGAQFGSNGGVSPRILTLPASFTQAIAEQPVSGLQAADFGDQAASVLLPPAQDQKVMIIGGGGNATTNRVNIVNLTVSNPTYTAAASLNYARMHHNAVILPDRTVFVCNGSSSNENTFSSILPAEIYNPATNTWTAVATPSITGRVYHSVALLLPDGRVITAGGNPNRDSYEGRIDIYSPAYMTQSRPVIQKAPSSGPYGGTITIQTPQAKSIKWVSLVRPMATTHGLDTDQRLVDLPINSRTSNSLKVAITSNRNLAPPGYYMLFITNTNNVPSVAKWIKLG